MQTVDTINEGSGASGVTIETNLLDSGQIHPGGNVGTYMTHNVTYGMDLYSSSGLTTGFRFNPNGDGHCKLILEKSAVNKLSSIEFIEDPGTPNIAWAIKAQTNNDFWIENVDKVNYPLTIDYITSLITVGIGIISPRINLTGKTPSKLVEMDASNDLQNVSDLTPYFVAGTNISFSGTEPLTINNDNTQATNTSDTVTFAKVISTELEYTGNITIDAINVGANSEIHLINSNATWKNEVYIDEIAGTGGEQALYIESGQIVITSSLFDAKMNITNIDNFDFRPYQSKKFQFRKKELQKDGTYKYFDEPSCIKYNYGLIAEDVEKLDNIFSTYDNKGNLAGIGYDRFISPLIAAVGTLQEKNKKLEDFIKKKFNDYEN
jgi:hypothetical protein